ncbi:MAG: hypothetical protein LBD98_03150 [Endomicrobium sp.]|jgi:hypothetical protein|nr:hypothetical protein [Endomicrobium sp.]
MAKPYNSEAEYYSRKLSQDETNNEDDKFNEDLRQQNLNSGINIDNPSQTSSINKHNFAKQAEYLKALAASRGMQTQMQNANLATQNALADSATQRKINRLQTMNTLASGRVDRSIAKKSLQQQQYQFEVDSNLRARQQFLNSQFQQHAISKDDFLQQTRANMEAAGMMFDMAKFKAAEKAAQDANDANKADSVKRQLLEAIGVSSEPEKGEEEKKSARMRMLEGLTQLAGTSYGAKRAAISSTSPLDNLVLMGLYGAVNRQ